MPSLGGIVCCTALLHLFQRLKQRKANTRKWRINMSGEREKKCRRSGIHHD